MSIITRPTGKIHQTLPLYVVNQYKCLWLLYLGSTSPKKKKKPKRPCPFCGKFSSNLRNHFNTVHKYEKQIKAINRLPPEYKTRAYKTLRKLGIYKTNITLLKDGNNS